MTSLIVAGALFFIGWALRLTRVFPDNAALTLNQYVVRVALPALILIRIPELKWQADLWVPVASAWLMLLAGWLLGLQLGTYLKLTQARRLTLALMLALGNTSFIAIPLLTLFSRPDAIPIALLYDQLGSFLGLAVLGSVLAQRDGQTPSIGQKLRAIVFFPPLIALLFATLCGRYTWVQQWFPALEPIAASLVPVVMVALGAQFSWQMGKTDRIIVTTALTIKMLILPALLTMLFLLTGQHGLTAQVSILEAAMPPMMSAAALASTYHLDEKLASRLVALGIAVSFITIPLWSSWLNLMFAHR